VSALPLGIVGYGKIARDQHEPAIAASGDFELIAVADPATAHERLPSYPDIAAMLADHPEIGAVSLCMQPHLRGKAARDAIATGRHVLLEKPPGTTVAEAEDLLRLAANAGTTVFTAWHSQEGAAVAAACGWLWDKKVRSVSVEWKEDVRVWHPGQSWIWQEGGFGVFDPGINALSILTAILPGELQLVRSELSVPANCAMPIAARLAIAGEGFPVTAEFDFRQTGPQSWDIAVETDRGRLLLSHGGNALAIDGVVQATDAEAEYPRLYARFGELIRAGSCEVDLAPLQLVEDALTQGCVTAVEPFEEFA
jgi:D-galactose 1-dehydrogenase